MGRIVSMAELSAKFGISVVGTRWAYVGKEEYLELLTSDDLKNLSKTPTEFRYVCLHCRVTWGEPGKLIGVTCPKCGKNAELSSN